MGKKDVSRSIKLEQEMDDFAVRVAGRLDCNVSALIRAALLIGVPTLMACPSLVRKLELDDMDLTTLGI